MCLRRNPGKNEAFQLHAAHSPVTTVFRLFFDVRHKKRRSGRSGKPSTQTYGTIMPVWERFLAKPFPSATSKLRSSTRRHGNRELSALISGPGRNKPGLSNQQDITKRLQCSITMSQPTANIKHRQSRLVLLNLPYQVASLLERCVGHDQYTTFRQQYTTLLRAGAPLPKTCRLNLKNWTRVSTVVYGHTLTG